MKKKGFIALIITIIAVLTIGLSVATADGGFELVESYPKDGATNAAVENLGVKLTFTTPVNSEANQEANNKCFKITGPDGDLPIKVYYNPKQAEQVLVLYDVTEGGQLVSRSSDTYKISISKDFMDNNGNILGDDIEITFDTINQKLNTSIYMIMMLVMMAGMVIYSMRQARKNMQEKETATKEEPFNPYKEAKRTGKSVEEVMAIHEKEQKKKDAALAKKTAALEEYYEEEEEVNTNYKVKGPRPISSAGGKYITGRKAAAEAKKAEVKRNAQGRKKKK